MKNIFIIGLIVSALSLIGCRENFTQPDLIPPSSPRGLATVTNDNLVEISWLSNPETDVAGYKVYVSFSYNGKYNFIGSTGETYFADKDSSNGNTYYYAVSAYDFAGNESELSQENVAGEL